MSPFFPYSESRANVCYNREKKVNIIRITNKFHIGDLVKIDTTEQVVTINKWSYVKNMKRFSYTVNEHPSTFYFEDELKKVQ